MQFPSNGIGGGYLVGVMESVAIHGSKWLLQDLCGAYGKVAHISNVDPIIAKYIP